MLPGAGADPIWTEPESARGPRTSGAGAAQKSGGFATPVKISLDSAQDYDTANWKI